MNCEKCLARSAFGDGPCDKCKFKSASIEEREIHGVKYFALKNTPIPTDNKYYTPMKSASTEQKQDPAWLTMAKQSGLLSNKVSPYLALTEGVDDIKQPIIKSASKKQEKSSWITLAENSGLI